MRSAEFYKSYNPKESNSETVDKPVVEENDNVTNLSKYLTDNGMMKSKADKLAKMADTEYAKLQSDLNAKNGKKTNTYMNVLSEIRRSLKTNSPSTLSKDIVSILNPNVESKVEPSVETVNDVAPTVKSITPEDIKSRNTKYAVGDEISYTKQTATGANAVYGTIKKIGVDSKGRNYITINKTGETDLTGLNKEKAITGTSTINPDNASFRDSKLEDAWNSRDIKSEPIQVEEKPVTKVEPETVKEEPVKQVSKTIEKTEKEVIKEQVSKKIDTAKTDIKLSLEDAVKNLETDTKAKLKSNINPEISNIPVNTEEVSNMDNAIKKAKEESIDNVKSFVDNSKQLANMVLNNTEGLKRKKQSKLVIENLGSVIDSMKQNAEPSTPQDAITQAAEKVAQASKNSDSKIDVNAFVDGIVATEPVEKEMTRESLIEKHLKEAYEKSDGNSQITNKNLSPKTNGATELEDYHLNKTLQEASELNLPEDVKRQINKLVKSENGAVTKETYHLLENQDRMFGLIDTYGLTGAYNEVMKNFDADPETNNVSAKSITRGDITFASAVLSRCNDNSRTFTNTLVSMLKNRTDFDGKTLYQVKKYMESHNTDANITPEMKSLLKVVNTYDFMAKNIALGAGAYTNTAGVALNESKLLRESFLTMSGEMRRAKLQKDIDTMNKYIVENTSKGKKFLEQNNGSNYLDSKHKDNPSYYKDILAEYEDAVNNGDEERAEQVFEKFKSSVQKDTPYTAGEVFRSLRFYHMLANPKTHLKNIVGNTFMAAMNASKNANQMVIEQLLKNKVMHHDALNLTDADYESMAKQSGIPAEEIQNKIEEYGMNYLNRRTNAITQAIKEYNEQLTGKDNYAKRERFFKEKGFTGDTLDMLLNKKDIGTADKSGIFSLSDPNKHALSSRAEVAIQNELISQMKAGKVKYNEETGKFTFTDEKGEYKFANSAYNNAVNKYIDESELKTAKVNRAEKKMALEYVKHLQKTGYLDMGTKWEKDTANTLLQGRAALPMFSEGTGIGSKIANLTPNIINKFIDVNSNGFKSVQEGGYLAKKFNNNEAIPILSAFGLDNEDRSDFQLATSTALAMDLKNKGYTLSKAADGAWSINGKSESESLKTISKMLDSAKVVGQEAVYRDNNYLINKANEWRKTSKVGDALLDVTVPFMKTPANIVRRGIEYSPVSFAVAAAQKKKLLRGEISASDYITNISKGMAGSELAVIGAMMGMAGIISGKDDDDDYNAKQYKQSIYGYQDYSLNIGGHHFDIADFAPASSIILGGVAISDAVKAAMAGHEDNENYFKDALNMCESIASGYWNSMVDTTMLQNIQDIGKSFSESTENGDAFGKAALNVTANYVSSLFPPILKWAGQIADSKERVTYSSDAAENLKLKVLQAAGMSSSLQPKLDSKGNEITKNDYGLGAAGRAYDIFLNIAKDSKDTHTAADDKILQLYKDTGDATLLGGTQTYFTKDGTKTTLSGTDGTEYNKVYKKTLNNELGNYLISDAYAHADEDMKKTVLSGIKAYATAEAIKSYYKRTNAVDVYSAMSDSMKELDSLASKNIMSPYQYYTYKSINGIEGVSNSKGLLVRNAMETAGVYDAYIDAYKSGQISTKSLVSDSVAEMTNDEFEYEFEKITSGAYDKTAEKTDADKLSSFNTKMSKNQDVLNTAKKIGLSGDNLYSLQDVTSTKDANGKNISYSQDISARNKAVKDGSWSKIVTAVKNGTITEDEAIKLTGIGKTVFEMSDSAFNVNSTALSNGTFTGKLSGSSSKWKSSSKSSSGTSSTKSTSTKSSSSTKTASSIKKSQLALYKKYVSSSNTSSSKIKTTSTSSQQALYNSIVNNHKSNIKSLKSKYKLS